MSKIIMILLVFSLSAYLLNAQVEDSAKIQRFIQDAEEEINTLDIKYRQIENLLRQSNKEFTSRYRQLSNSDSLQLLAYKDLLSKNEELKKEVEQTRDSANNKIYILQQELYEARKGNATLLIILFSLIVISFIYLFYRNYRVEVQTSEKFFKAGVETEQKIQKLKNNFRKKLTVVAGSIDKNVRKRIKKSDKSFNKKLRKLKK